MCKARLGITWLESSFAEDLRLLLDVKRIPRQRCGKESQKQQHLHEEKHWQRVRGGDTPRSAMLRHIWMLGD